MSDGEAAKMTVDSGPRSFKDELLDIVLDGRRRAEIRTRLMRLLDQQLAALKHATDADIERVRQDARKLIEFTDVLLGMGMLSSIRDNSQNYTVKQTYRSRKRTGGARGE
jgi:hypothetical protein